MSEEFLKWKSKEERDKRSRKLAEVMIGIDDRSWYRNKAKYCLDYLGEMEEVEAHMLYERIVNCTHKGRDKRVCGSIYCVNCGIGLAEKLEKRYIKNLGIENNQLPMGRGVNSATLLQGICEVDYESVRDEVAGLRKRIQEVHRVNPELYSEGYIELELVDAKQARRIWGVEIEGEENVKQLKKRKLSYILEHHKHRSRWGVLVHFHGLVSSSWDRGIVKKQFDRVFQEKHSVMLKVFPFNGQDVEKATHNWCSYIMKVPFTDGRSDNGYRKDMYRFKDSFVAKTDIDEVMHDERLMPFSLVAKMMLIQRQVAGDNNKGLFVRRSPKKGTN